MKSCKNVLLKNGYAYLLSWFVVFIVFIFILLYILKRIHGLFDILCIILLIYILILGYLFMLTFISLPLFEIIYNYLSTENYCMFILYISTPHRNRNWMFLRYGGTREESFSCLPLIVCTSGYLVPTTRKRQLAAAHN